MFGRPTQLSVPGVWGGSLPSPAPRVWCLIDETCFTRARGKAGGPQQPHLCPRGALHSVPRYPPGYRDAHHLPHLPRSVTAGAKMAVPRGEVPRHAWKRILQVHVTLERGRASAHSSGTAAPCPGSRGEIRAVTLRGDTGSLPAAPPCLEVESLQPPAGTERPGRFLDLGSSANKTIMGAVVRDHKALSQAESRNQRGRCSPIRAGRTPPRNGNFQIKRGSRKRPSSKTNKPAARRPANCIPAVMRENKPGKHTFHAM